MRVDNKPISVYEKAFPQSLGLEEKIMTARRMGFSGIEISIDSDPARLARLDWSKEELSKLRGIMAPAGFNIQSICLSAHREIPLGSSDHVAARESLDIGLRAIDIASELEVPFVQIAGYFTSDGDWSESSRTRFIAALAELVLKAERSGVQLALENVDGQDVLNAQDGIQIVREIDSPALRLYVDVGNYVANGLNALEELQRAIPYACAIQLKDTRPGEFRRVEFGSGQVPFRELIEECLVDFATLPLSLELWNDGNSNAHAERALAWFERLWTDISSYRWDQLQSDDHSHSH